jgi:hypothetical protein
LFTDKISSPKNILDSEKLKNITGRKTFKTIECDLLQKKEANRSLMVHLAWLLVF